MNLSKQIKKYRERDGYSQEYLAEKLYVSRQSISNWENDKSLPDIHNLLMMCDLFNVTLDDLVKGTIPFVLDVKVQRSFNLWTYVMLIFLTLAAILMGPLVVYWNWAWGITVVVIYGIGLYASMKVEGLKKEHKMDNYDRIVAFMNGKDPSEVQTTKARNTMTNVLSVISVVGAFILIALISMYLAIKFL
ncbi:helix-turn-helix transcriptional regulator [Staphylococcus argenteus]|uniref:helix-turn-helix transcriptional regulator n=1 Tax=Staphylococcus argenteus TaxID=985002 RepID=UPI0005057583|nr:helix-turn-helix transcriptional regulator [Staphylococcus argenteus]MBE5665892.1 helix-turn-helix transcriptional regulator [Staphylococcus singaporensis]MBE2133190.1 helix-turn-helix transcriptional regulator [Staphylococcus argenteus]MBE2146979.1 helix-turn-helix transcriptional regulator [Staphylococcus argenteus]MBE2160977.1 helix-turn-helix transcriptional regulator [Staphylococcus argenteus]MBE5677811.1 helix-turn-helix transcriptional regulator [Staphylococcus singaporensis]